MSELYQSRSAASWARTAGQWQEVARRHKLVALGAARALDKAVGHERDLRRERRANDVISILVGLAMAVFIVSGDFRGATSWAELIFASAYTLARVGLLVLDVVEDRARRREIAVRHSEESMSMRSTD
jgi:hypothetical protein